MLITPTQPSRRIAIHFEQYSKPAGPRRALGHTQLRVQRRPRQDSGIFRARLDGGYDRLELHDARVLLCAHGVAFRELHLQALGLRTQTLLALAHLHACGYCSNLDHAGRRLHGVLCCVA